MGLDDDQLEALARAEGGMKLSRADIAACLASGQTGATTTVTGVRASS